MNELTKRGKTSARKRVAVTSALVACGALSACASPQSPSDLASGGVPHPPLPTRALPSSMPQGSALTRKYSNFAALRQQSTALVRATAGPSHRSDVTTPDGAAAAAQ